MKQFKTHYFVINLPRTWFTAGANCHKSSLQFQNPHEITNCIGTTVIMTYEYMLQVMMSLYCMYEYLFLKILKKMVWLIF